AAVEGGAGRSDRSGHQRDVEHAGALSPTTGRLFSADQLGIALTLLSAAARAPCCAPALPARASPRTRVRQCRPQPPRRLLPATRLATRSRRAAPRRR